MIYNRKLYHLLFIIPAVAVFPQALLSQKTTKPTPPVYFEKGKLLYTPDSSGNRVPDFSFCGYMASESEIPFVPVKITVPPQKGDATERIQSALDYVAALPADVNGFRGAVLLLPGSFEIDGQLQLNTSGIVLRGSGSGNNGTRLIGAGTGRLALVKITIPKKNKITAGTELKISDAYVPVNATRFHLATSPDPQIWMNPVIIRRPATKAWIAALGCDIFGGGISALGWKPGERDLFFDRKIVKINGNEITIDAPITTALDTTFGGGFISLQQENGRVSNCGIENLQMVSAFDKNNEKDEDHRWNAINIENAEDAWVRQILFQHFAGSAVSILETSKRVTVEDCKSMHPVSETGGQRRYTFLTAGQQTLFQRCYSENGYHDFATGFCTPGPNAFVQCTAVQPFSFSGPIDSWSSGVLYDLVNIDGNALRLGNRGQDASGAGWAAANSVCWNCSAARIDCFQPPTAQNWAFGSWSQFEGNGYWGESNNSINPASLFYAQLSARLNKNTGGLAKLAPQPTEASSSPSVETAAKLTKEATIPKLLLPDWIDSVNKNFPVSLESKQAISVEQIAIKKKTIPETAPVLQIKNGWLVRGNKILTGARQNVPWWNGGLTRSELQNAKPHITRFVPGRTGNGLTDDLNEVTDEMKDKNILVLEHNYGLWYDRRRDDHERVRRMDGEVWPPFYELPFARSGKETAWDGLSKYDLTKYNLFYWSRLKQFADLADQKGLLLVHQNYFQHNIIEAGAHYADFPWRTANNINQTGLNEPVQYAGDKRIFYAEQFYDNSHPKRRELHKKYIRQCLNNFKDNSGVIQFIGEEFTGPLHFVKFWLDVIRDWEKETGKHPMIGLSVTKDVQDSILAMPAYRSLIKIIDIRYWYYQADGTAYAPMGGQNLAPRQHARLLKPKKTSFEQVYRAVKEYREKYPDKAIMYSGDSYPEFGMAAFMAGGSLAWLPEGTNPNILEKAVNMKPASGSEKNRYRLTDGKNSIIYNTALKKLEFQQQ